MSYCGCRVWLQPERLQKAKESVAFLLFTKKPKIATQCCCCVSIVAIMYLLLLLLAQIAALLCLTRGQLLITSNFAASLARAHCLVGQFVLQHTVLATFMRAHTHK